MAKLIDGKLIAENISKNLAVDVASLASSGFQPHLAVVQIGSREDSTIYVKMKEKSATKIGIKFTYSKYPESISQSQVMQVIQKLNEDHKIHGILVQLPLPGHLDEKLITEAIDVRKDVDGFHSGNIGLLAKKNASPFFEACTPKGVLELLKHENVQIKGKRAVVVGRSNIVGMPLSHILQNEDATVTVCHSKTENMAEICRSADILVAAVGCPNMIKGSWLKPGAVVIDVGTNAVPDSSKKSGIRWVGDVEFETAKQVVSLITPVPGGVGPMTVAMLMQNTVESAKRFRMGIIEPVEYLIPDFKNPVPRYF